MKTIITDENICSVNEKILSTVAKFVQSNQSRFDLQPIYVIVPDRATLQTEKFLASKCSCLLNVRVLTFSMLYNVLHGESNIQVLDKTSGVLFTWQAIRAVRESLRYFHKSVDQYAFAEKMFNTINQLKSCMADFKCLERNSNTEITKRKMHDISLIQSEYKRLTSEYLDGSGILGWLIDNIGKCDLLKDVHMYVTGFEHLSVQRMEIIRLLQAKAKSFTMGVQNGTEVSFAM